MGNRNTKSMVLAVDIGASGGRAMLGTYDGNGIQIQEIHRFLNEPVTIMGTMYWDVLRLFHEIKQSLLKAKQYGTVESIAVDTWGVDFGLLDEDGRMLENPIHYRDGRTHGMIGEALKHISKEELYSITGNQFMEINTLFQLISLQEKRPDLLKRARRLLLMPDLFHYFLSGETVAEASAASTTQLFDAGRKSWSHALLQTLALPESLFCPIVPSGTVIGSLTAEICAELDLPAVKVIAVAGHDTQSALVAVPAVEEDFLFLSSGTWSLLGTELDQPVTDETARKLNLTNEAAVGGKTSFLKNIIGLWLIQESRRQWQREGREYSFAALEEMAEESVPFGSFIDPDDPVFVPPGNIPGRIRDYCRRTGQPVPEDEAAIVRCINESLAMKYRCAAADIRRCTGKEYQTMYLVGGGAQSRQLCQMTANSCQCGVSAGPAEATALGNIAVQLIALGNIKDLKQVRKLIRESTEIRLYRPEDLTPWDEAFKRFRQVTGCV